MADRIKYALYLCLLMPLAWLPLWMLYGLSDLLYFIAYHCTHYRIAVVRRHLADSFPEKSSEDLRDIERKFYRQLCDDVVETIKLLHISDKELNRRVEVCNAEAVQAIASEGFPIFLYLGHYCNWEWVPQITRHWNNPKTCAQIYKPLHDRVFDKVMLRVRSRFGALNVPQNEALRTLFRLRRDEGTYIVGILDDHSPNHGRSHHYMTFLNHPGTIINVGAEEIGGRVDARYLYLDVEKLSRGHYRMTLKPIVPAADYPDYPVSREYMRMLEATIRRQPPYWLWSHKRWRYTAPEANSEIQ